MLAGCLARILSLSPLLSLSHPHTHALTHIYACARAHTHTHTYTHAHAHTHIHTFAHAHSLYHGRSGSTAAFIRVVFEGLEGLSL